ncbi:MAG: hypothetical protein NUV97_04100 [archaeon]|nr:hypothetical protein [archaeon]
MKFGPWYDKNYKKLLIIPAVVLVASIIYLILFTVQTGDIISKDISLTGGSTISVFTEIPVQEIETALNLELSDFSIHSLEDNTGRQLEVIITVGEENTKTLETTLENFLGYKLTSENSSRETTSASLSQDFYKQLIVAIILAFFWMAAVVFIIFSKGKGPKFKVIVVNILFGFFLGNYLFSLPPIFSWFIFLLFASYLIYTYIKNSVPAFAVMLAAFADIVMTLAVVNLIGTKLSIAGIVAFLMLIGYSVDTDILLTTRLLKKNQNTNQSLLGAFKTGTTMTLTSIVAVTTALIAVYSFGSVLNQILTILIIGLCFDIFNTWITNASIIKWYLEKKE